MTFLLYSFYTEMDKDPDIPINRRTVTGRRGTGNSTETGDDGSDVYSGLEYVDVDDGDVHV